MLEQNNGLKASLSNERARIIPEASLALALALAGRYVELSTLQVLCLNQPPPPHQSINQAIYHSIEYLPVSKLKHMSRKGKERCQMTTAKTVAAMFSQGPMLAEPTW
jgi:hypothetical protein